MTRRGSLANPRVSERFYDTAWRPGVKCRTALDKQSSSAEQPDIPPYDSHGNTCVPELAQAAVGKQEAISRNIAAGRHPPCFQGDDFQFLGVCNGTDTELMVFHNWV